MAIVVCVLLSYSKPTQTGIHKASQILCVKWILSSHYFERWAARLTYLKQRNKPKPKPLSCYSYLHEIEKCAQLLRVFHRPGFSELWRKSTVRKCDSFQYTAEENYTEGNISVSNNLGERCFTTRIMSEKCLSTKALTYLCVTSLNSEAFQGSNWGHSLFLETSVIIWSENFWKLNRQLLTVDMVPASQGCNAWIVTYGEIQLLSLLQSHCVLDLLVCPQQCVLVLAACSAAKYSQWRPLF